MKSKRLLFSLALINLSVFAIFAQNDLAKDAQFMLNEEQYSKAIQIINSLPENSCKQALLGKAYYGLNQDAQAKEAFQKAAVDPLCLDGALGLLGLEYRAGNKNVATVGFDKIIKANKKNANISAIVIRYCLDGENPDTTIALRYLRNALKVNYKNAQYQILSGDINNISNQIGKAANDYERAIYYDAKNIEAYRKLGIIYTRAKSFSDGLDAFNKSIEINPNQILVYKYLGDLYYTFGKYANAEASYKTYLERADPTTRDLERYGFILFFNKKYDEANAFLDQIIGKSKSETIIYRLKGYMAFETGDYANGVTYMSKFFLGHDPSRIISSDYGYYGRLLAKTKQDSLAMINYEKALDMDSTNMDYLDELGKIYSLNKQQDNAIDVYKRMIANGKDRSTMNFNIGKEYYYKGDGIRAKYDVAMLASGDKATPLSDSLKTEMLTNYMESQKAFDIVTELSPDSYISYLWKGRIQSILDPKAEGVAAKENYEKALAILEKGDSIKGKKPLIECYKALGTYYTMNFEKAKGSLSAEYKNNAISYLEKALALDPSDQSTIALVTELKGL
jgi:tetratricopeptide (TPR) repeat protein